jgi:hypothetical protein
MSERSISRIEHPESVLAAVAEYEDLGEEAFLERYGYAKSQRYFLEIDGRRYDSKAIVGAAFGHEFPEQGFLRTEEFSGGAATVQPLLERLGFSVEVEPTDLVTRDRGYWWVNQGETFREARASGFLWAPMQDKAGRRPAHWRSMAKVQQGDLVLHYASGSLRAVSLAKAPAFAADKPNPQNSQWTLHGQQHPSPWLKPFKRSALSLRATIPPGLTASHKRRPLSLRRPHLTKLMLS